MPKTFEFPVWLQGSPEEQAAENERQALALAAHGRGHLSEAERFVGRGELLEKTARGNLEAAGDNEEARILALSQWADAVAMQGQFAVAAEAHPDPVRKEHFEKIVAALEMPDEEKCNCSDTEVTIKDVELAITPRFEEDRIFSPVHGEVVSLVTCSKCGHQNARPLRSRLLPMNAARSQAEAVGRPVLNDFQVLKKPNGAEV